MDPALGCGANVGVDTVGVGLAPFYELDYGGYLVAMNTTTDQTFTYRSGRTGMGVDLLTGRRVPLALPVRVPPQTTVVWFDPSQRST